MKRPQFAHRVTLSTGQVLTVECTDPTGDMGSGAAGAAFLELAEQLRMMALAAETAGTMLVALGASEGESGGAA